MHPFHNPAVEKIFDSYPAPARRQLMALRALIFKTATDTDGVGALEETLKWGEPAYLTVQSKSGSTLRIAWKPARPEHYAMYFNCQTSLVETFRTMFPNDFQFEGNRAIVFELSEKPPKRELAWCVTAALTYHQRR